MADILVSESAEQNQQQLLVFRRLRDNGLVINFSEHILEIYVKSMYPVSCPVTPCQSHKETLSD